MAYNFTFTIGIDPSLNSSGVAIVCSNGLRIVDVFKTDPKKTTPQRLKHLYDLLNEFYNNIGSNACAAVAIEQASYGSVGKHDQLGQVRGMFSLWASQLGVEPCMVAPSTLKKFATCNGNAEKEDVMKAALDLGWVIKPKQYDASDAAMLAEFAWAIVNPHKVGHLKRKQLDALMTIELARSNFEKEEMRLELKAISDAEGW
jgi:Holliday junction resolvasome RuvABC endonuclease subunit